MTNAEKQKDAERRWSEMSEYDRQNTQQTTLCTQTYDQYLATMLEYGFSAYTREQWQNRMTELFGYYKEI